MKILRGLPDAAPFRGGFVSIGNFDGVHLGHRSMIAALTRRARELNVPALVFTFDPHPIALLRPAQAPPPLTTTDRKLELLAQFQVDAVLVYPTDEELLKLSPREFFDQIIIDRLNARGLVEGPNFCFGRNRAGTVETLRGYCAEAGLALEVVDPVTSGELLVSSTEIRRLITAGDVRRAGELLGANYRVQGVVTTGARRGRTIGFPTANIVDVPTVLPRDGVYAGRAAVDGTWFAAAINLGPNPTFAEECRKFEVHLLDYQGDLYGRTVEVEFLQRLRDTRPFGGIDELKQQLQLDVAQARAIAASEQ